MTTNTHIHRPVMVEAKNFDGSSWLEITDSSGNTVAVFMDAYTAEAMADAWAQAQEEPEPLDADTVAVRQAMTEQHIANAGRGHLLVD